MNEPWFAFTKRDGRAEIVLVLRAPDWFTAFGKAPKDFRSFGRCDLDAGSSRLRHKRDWFQWRDTNRQLLRGFK